MTIIHNSKFYIKNSTRGYTLVELLAVTSIVVIISGLIVGILYSTLRGGNKTKVTNDVTQNGNFALSVISNTALLSEDVTKVGGLDVTDCTSSPSPSGTSIEFQDVYGALVSFTCTGAPDDTIASQSAETVPTDLIDISSVKVDASTCSFSCVQSNGNPYSKPVIKISFTVTQKSTTPLFESAASSTFSTSVTMRNYNPR